MDKLLNQIEEIVDALVSRSSSNIRMPLEEIKRRIAVSIPRNTIEEGGSVVTRIQKRTSLSSVVVNGQKMNWGVHYDFLLSKKNKDPLAVMTRNNLLAFTNTNNPSNQILQFVGKAGRDISGVESERGAVERNISEGFRFITPPWSSDRTPPMYSTFMLDPNGEGIGMVATMKDGASGEDRALGAVMPFRGAAQLLAHDMGKQLLNAMEAGLSPPYTVVLLPIGQAAAYEKNKAAIAEFVKRVAGQFKFFGFGDDVEVWAPEPGAVASILGPVEDKYAILTNGSFQKI